MIGGDHSSATPTLRTMIEICAHRETCVDKMTCNQAHCWSNQLIDGGFVIEQSNRFRTLLFNHSTRRRAWSMRCTPHGADLPIMV